MKKLSVLSILVATVSLLFSQVSLAACGEIVLTDPPAPGAAPLQQLQLIKGWVSSMLKIWLATLDQIVVAFTQFEFSFSYFLYDEKYAYAKIFEYIARVFILWLIALWLYRKKIFIKV